MMLSNLRLSLLRSLIACCALAAGCDDAAKDGPSTTGSATAPAAASSSAAAAASSAPAPAAAYEAAGLTFQPKQPLPVKENIGGTLPAIEFGIPDAKDAKQRAFRLIIAEFPSGAGGPAASGDTAAMLTMGRGTYLANAKPPESKVERTILGQKVTGAKASGSIPRPTVSEAYVFERAPKQFVFVGFKYDKSFDSERADELIASVCASLAAKQ